MSIDIIGTLWTTPVEPLMPIALSGYHVNVTQDEIDRNPDLQSFVVTPARLRRVWAGDDPVDPDITIALRFMSDAQAKSVMGLD